MTRQALEKCIEGTKEERLFLCEHSFLLFAIYYFSKYFHYALAPYHYEMSKDLEDLLKQDIREVAWIMYRESGKTSFAKLFVVWCIAYKKKRYLNIDAFDRENAERILFDVAFELTDNKRLLADFPPLFSRKRAVDEIKQNRINNFVTENGIRVEAHSTQESMRGRVHLDQRPDLLICDDIETNKTKDSEAYTKQVRDHLSEALAGMSTDGNIIYLGNYLTEFGNIQALIDRAETDKKLRIRNVPVVIDGRPAWPAKYAMTDAEAEGTNKVSLEDKQRQLGSYVYSYEMLNQPVDEAMAEFKKDFVQYETEDFIKNHNTNCYVTIDSAVSEKESADYTGVTINRITSENKWYIKTYRLKINSKELIDHLFYLHQTLRPDFIGLEETTFTQAIQPFLRDEMRKRQTFFNVTPVKHKGVNKETRIRGLIPRWESRSIILLGDNTELLDELRSFPRGQFDDCIAEDVLILTDKGQVPIQNVKIGDNVMTRKGYKKVLKTWEKGEKLVIKKFGVVGTPEHRVITKEGEKPLCKLDESSILYVWNEILLCIEEKSITDIRSQHDSTSRNITGRIQDTYLTHYIGKFGLIIMEKFRKVFMYTIKTKTLSIMQSKILSLYQQATMQSIIQINQQDLKNKVGGQKKTIKNYRSLQKNGEIALKVKNGTQSILKKVSTSLKKLYVQSVGQKLLDILGIVNTAQTDAETKRSSETIALDIQILEKRKVYDLTVEDEHEFFANNVLVHNCLDSLAMQLQHAEAPASERAMALLQEREYQQNAQVAQRLGI
jgi:phage terminase large subunit-like protein